MPRPVTLLTAVLVLYGALLLPNHPGAATWGALRVFPLELPALILGMMLLGGRLLRLAITGALTLMTALKLADFAANSAFGRPFNLLLDMHLAPAGWRMLSGAAGLPLALAGVVGVLLAVGLLARAIWWATGRIAASGPPPLPRRGALLALLAALVLPLVDAARESRPFDPPGVAFTGRLAWEHGRDVLRARTDLADFRRLTAQDALAGDTRGTGFGGLGTRDVFLVFVESYGRTAIDTPLYAGTIRPTLREMEATLTEAGLVMRSGFLTAPMTGGQSWLAHASVLSGLRIENQGRYRALLASPRRTLLHFAQAAGWDTVAVMPAITLAWPEALFFGYDRVLAAADLGYRGQPFNWVTMPDQFTLAAFERGALDPPDRPPVFAEIALISSHAPWTPIPDLLSWETLGDGTIFDAVATGGETPQALWRDMDRVRDHFRRALDYSLRSVGAFAERRAATAPLFIVLGDHQPAEIVSLTADNRDVPIHLIGPPEVIARFDAFGWRAGMIPDPATPAWPMEDFRDRFIGAVSDREPPA